MSYIQLDTCPICASRNVTDNHQTGAAPRFYVDLAPGFSVLAGAVAIYSLCNDCGVLYQNPRLDDEQIGRYYAEGIYRKSLNMDDNRMDTDEAHRAQVDCHALLQVLASPLADGQTGLARLLAGADQTRYKLRATGAPFEAKDKLKSRGYRWDGEGRVWWCSVGSDDLLDAECTWLRDEVYGCRSARVMLEALDSLVQYSSRSGLQTERQL